MSEPKTMLAIVKEAPQVGVTMKEVPIPSVGPNDVKIKIHYTSICGTDVHIYQWNEWAQNVIKPPLTIGHEYVGEIVDIGANVEGFTIGELVTGEGHIVCGKCRNCRTGKPHLCKEAKGVGVNRDGAFAEYLVIPATNAWKCAPGIPEELFSCFDPYGNATHTALSYNLIGEDVLITGAGPIGIMAVAIAKHVGARKVVITDLNEYRLDLARKMGADAAINVGKENITTVMKELGITDGFNVGLETSGSEPGLNTMIDNMYNGGKIAILGIPKKDTKIDWEKVVFNGLFIKGIYGREMFDTWYKMGAMLQGGLDISSIITHRFDIRDFQKGFDAMISGNSGKVVLDWTQLHK
ncbi:MAG: L-threonine 3-dehydrogenase [Lachnospiraceae bacterium]